MKNNYKTFKDLKIGGVTEITKGFWIKCEEDNYSPNKYVASVLFSEDGVKFYDAMPTLFKMNQDSYTPEQITKIMLKIQGKPNPLQMAWVYTFTVLQALLYILIRASYTFSINKGMPSLKFWKTEEEMVQKDIKRLASIIIFGSAPAILHHFFGWYWTFGIAGFYFLLNLIVAKVKVNKYKRKNQ